MLERGAAGRTTQKMESKALQQEVRRASRPDMLLAWKNLTSHPGTQRWQTIAAAEASWMTLCTRIRAVN